MQEWLRDITYYISQGFAQMQQPFDIEGFALNMHLALREMLYSPMAWTSQKPASDFLRLAVPDIVAIFTADPEIATAAMAHDCLIRYAVTSEN